ncbi:MAG: polysaccharide deacetylase family protein [Clostridia bacterium]|nr:polysaccharide deacetylase family protein [Clostridia bacterium]
MYKTIPSIFVRFPEGRSKALTFSYDDGFISDDRLVKLFDEHNLKATFNLSTGKYLSEDKEYREDWIWNYHKKSDATAIYGNTVHEIAVHGYSHPFLATLPPASVAHEVLTDRRSLEEQFGTIIRGMAYPKGSYDDKVVDVLKACGIVYSRVVRSSHKFDLPSDWLRLEPTCHHGDPKLMELAKNFVDKKIRFHSQMFYLWGHTYEFMQNDNWNVIEEFVEFMSGREDEIWYATNIEIYEYLEDFNHLIFSADLTIAKNPTSRKLWFSLDNDLVSIEPGETKKIR